MINHRANYPQRDGRDLGTDVNVRYSGRLRDGASERCKFRQTNVGHDGGPNEMDRHSSAQALGNNLALRLTLAASIASAGCGGQKTAASGNVDGASGLAGSGASTDADQEPDSLHFVGDVVPVPTGYAYVGKWYFDAERRTFVRPLGCHRIPQVPEDYGNKKLLVPSFFLQETPVTNGLYWGCVTAGACTPPDHDIGDPTPRPWDDPARTELPVYGRHDQAETYCRWGKGRLPSTAELHRAAQGDSGLPGVAALTQAAVDCYGAGSGTGNAQPVCGQLELMNYEGLTPPPLYRVNGFELDRGPFGHTDLFGSVGEWTRTLGGEGPDDGLCDLADGTQDFVTFPENAQRQWHDVVGFATSVIRGVKLPGSMIGAELIWPDGTNLYNIGFRCAFDSNPYGPQ
jgi:formylglycine-generating enzyme required for sulfatase activity